MCVKSLIFRTGLLFVVLVPFASSGANFSSQNEDWHPLAISADGTWLMYGDGAGRLIRRNIKTNDERVVEIQSGSKPTSISLSRSGIRAIATYGCTGVALIDFAQALPSTDWIRYGGSTCQHSYYPASISQDGEMYAMYARLGGDWQIGIFQAREKKLLSVFPVAGSAEHLEFMPGNRFILIVSTRERTQRDYTVWDTHYSVWDIANRGLYNDVIVTTAFRPDQTTILATSHFGGVGWAIRQEHISDSPEFIRIPLRGCAGVVGVPNAVSMERQDTQPNNFHWAADGFGRWLAVARPAKVDPGKFAIEFYDVTGESNGGGEKLNAKRVAVTYGSGVISEVYSTLDGTTLWATLVDGRLIHVDVPKEALLLSPARVKSSDICRPEDEVADARDVLSKAPTHMARKLGEISMLKTNPSPQKCHADGIRPEYVGKSEGPIVIDKGMELLFYDPANGRLMRRIPTPRSRGMCTINLPKHESFLTYDANTISLYPWDGGEGHVVVSNPGWQIERIYAGFSGEGRDFMLVAWARAGADTTKKSIGEFSALYSLKTGELLRQEAMSRCASYPQEPVLSCDKFAVGVEKDDLKRFGLHQEYSAQIDDFKGLVVRHKDFLGDVGTVIFRAGGEGKDAADIEPDSDEPKNGTRKEKISRRAVTSYYSVAYVLNDHVVLGIKGTGIDLYDFQKRKLIATLDESPHDQYVPPVWDEGSGALWFSGDNFMLQGWQIDLVK